MPHIHCIYTYSTHVYTSTTRGVPTISVFTMRVDSPLAPPPVQCHVCHSPDNNNNEFRAAWLPEHVIAGERRRSLLKYPLTFLCMSDVSLQLLHLAVYLRIVELSARGGRRGGEHRGVCAQVGAGKVTQFVHRYHHTLKVSGWGRGGGRGGEGEGRGEVGGRGEGED